MTPGLFLAVAIAGGVGAALRFLVDGLVRARTRGPFPLGTALINLSGSLLLGLLLGLAGHGALPDAWRLVAGTGLLGGYTTFSTASVETVRLAQQRRWLAFWVDGLGVALAAVLLAGAGLLLGAAI